MECAGASGRENDPHALIGHAHASGTYCCDFFITVRGNGCGGTVR